VVGRLLSVFDKGRYATGLFFDNPTAKIYLRPASDIKKYIMTGPIKETIDFGSIQLNFLLDGEDTNNTMVVFEFIVQPKAKVPAPHFHVAVDELLYGLEGILTQTIGGKVLELNPGDKCFIPRGMVHGFTNEHDVPAKVLCVLSPASIGPAYFREIAEVVNAGGPPDMQRVLAVMQRHGLEPVRPGK
jgi:quercetin dioxygenase-like cupin family protein